MCAVESLAPDLKLRRGQSMYLNRFAAILDFLLGRRRKLALCPIRTRERMKCVFVVAALLLSARAAEATVLINGDVTPSAGNFADPSVDPNPVTAAANQVTWEGILDVAANTNVNTDVYVGRTASGILQISQVELRDMNLVIGDSVKAGTLTQVGNGTVYITGLGSLFNNDPNRNPPNLPANFKSKQPRTGENSGHYVTNSTGTNLTTTNDGLDGYNAGFDMYVGKSGNGTLRIDAFGRAEIADAVLVGDSAGATGNVVVDGFNSVLMNGGAKDYGNTTETSFHMTIIGRQGTGNLTISNGATMATQTFLSSGGGGTQGAVAASLGSSPYTLLASGGTTMDAGGTGTATITGSGSKWVVGGSFQVGGFDIGSGTGGVFSTGGDLEGDNTTYGSQAGKGTLYVNDGGLVQINNAADVVAGSGGVQTPLLLAIGRFGTVQLNGGTIQVGSALGNSGGGQNQATPDTVQVINDGLITGTGTINTGVFRNRYLGQVRVDAGQSLVVNSSSSFLTAGGATPSEPLTNYGHIQVFGNSQAQAQLEFVRAPGDRPFLNLPLVATSATAPTPPAFVGGQISAQYANLRFGSGLQNQSILAFTAGTNNVTGRVVNLALDTSDTESGGETAQGDAGETTQVLVSGSTTTAVFADDLAFGTGADLNLVDGGKVVVLNQHSFTLSGNLGINLSYTHPSLITVAGDVGIGSGTTDLSLNLASDALHSLKHGDSFQLISFGGDIGNVNITNPNNPIPDLTKLPVFADIDVSPDVFALYGLVPQIQFSNEGVYAVFLDPTKVGPGAGAVAPDFNGDGVVDLKDFAIWQAHVGIRSGASVLDGDADGDGDVDGADFLKWQRNVGKVMPWTGSGSGSGSSSQLSAVPEPTSLMLLACGSLALAFGRRRAQR
jgi:T5SS/PEP-CTERM-associated repeat protein